MPNRENGRNGEGPAFTEGKAWSRRNAINQGLFSRELVVAAAGERQEDFDALLSGLRNQFPAQDFLIAFLTGDLAKLFGVFSVLMHIKPRKSGSNAIRPGAVAAWRRWPKSTH